ncbi:MULTISPECIES: hypothetical protein [Nocardiaceae]|uniref:ANTAR domain-containing protein n=1 Tax=Rhodococcoides corynebacterioides TaxID=53972 RepID=A0ABS2KN76_9NOCA|nr:MULTISPECIES: hypothetical protein [Rhodococcus]MBM7413353.1 hypothetical protein [Rhodococcus corynebacterioides]MBP1115816.1 hypothetical protein [Rhodococcus sp. PvP016]
MDDPGDATASDGTRLGPGERLSDFVDVCVGVAGADSGAVVVSSPRHPDTRRVLHTTDSSAERIADLLYLHGADVDLVSSDRAVGRTIVVGGHRDAARWPLLIDDLVAADVGWVRVLPLGAVDAPLGCVQLHRRSVRSGPSPAGTEVLIEHLVRVIGPVVAGDAALATVDGAEDGDTDLTSVAIGILVARHAVAVDVASAMLRAGAVARAHSSVEEARRIIATLHGRGEP